MVKIFLKLFWAIWYHRFDNLSTNFSWQKLHQCSWKCIDLSPKSQHDVFMHAYLTPLPKNRTCVNSILNCPSPCFSSPSPFLLSYPLFLSSCHAFCSLSSVPSLCLSPSLSWNYYVPLLHSTLRPSHLFFWQVLCPEYRGWARQRS